MAFNVQQFRSQMTADGARPNLFQCSIPNFPGLATGGGQTNPGGGVDGTTVQEKFTFMCRASQLPGAQINSIPVNYFGRELKFAGNRTFPEWTVTIINDEDFKLKNTFEKWMHGLNSHVSNIRASQFRNSLAGGYTADAFITQFAKTGEALKDYKFVGIFPIDVSPIEVDWGANDQIEEFAVTFAYQWWESNTTENAFVNP